MRYLVQFEASIQGGRAAEQKGTVAPSIGRLMDLVKPECFYLTPTRRAGWFVTEIDEPGRMAEIMALLTEGLGCEYPTFTPVVPVSEFAEIAQRTTQLVRDGSV